ncbi:MAG: peptide chain release factor 1 [Candidatus Omnitrophica bacterium]|nr:peptide chain release factor 1 [Candidatus Omnitrophota bacterium]
MIKKFQELEDRLVDIEKNLTRPEIINDKTKYQKYSKELNRLSFAVNKFREFKRITQEMDNLKGVISDSAGDPELKKIAEQELLEYKHKKDVLWEELESIFLEEDDPNIGRNIIMEIRAGAGGQEACLFVNDLYRMYSRFADQNNLKCLHIDSHPTDIGGFKEMIFSVEGGDAYGLFKFESGVHRVQRVPTTESSGRIHTSTVSVVVMPEPEDVEFQIEPKDLRIDVYRSSGPGGQGVNTTDSAVRITHIPTNIVVACQDERSQLKNKTKAMRVLKARLLDARLEEQRNKISQTRKAFIGTGDRSEKIRTYNFPQRRVTDHRIELTLYRLEAILEGDLKELIDALYRAEKEEKLKQKTGEKS